MTFYKQAILTACVTTVSSLCLAQVGVQKLVSYNKRPVSEPTPITNQATGQLMTISEYTQLTKTDPFAYHLVPNYDEYGRSSTYTMRVSTPEERETHRFRDRDPAKQPKAGQPIDPFVMTDVLGKDYRSADLLGKVVILNFWVSLDKSVWDEKQATNLAEALRPYPSSSLVVLGVFNSEHPKSVDEAALKKLPFVPVPNAYGFHNKYHITTVPTLVVIDKTGKVAANLQGADCFEQLKLVLATLTK